MFGVFAFFSLISLLDTVFSKKKLFDRFIQRRANKRETTVYEAKKREYFSVLGVTEEDLQLLPKTE